MRATLFLIPLLLSSAGCSSQADYARETGVQGKSAATAIATGDAEAAAFTDNVKRDDAEREFSYKWPAQVSAQPELVKQLTADRDKTLAQEKAEWEAAVKDCPADAAPCRNRSYAMEWKVVADTPRFLSLSGDFSSYTGGAHGMYGLRSLVWDKTAKKGVDGAALFRSPAALDAALGPKLCAALNAERARKRGAPVDPNAPDEFGTGFDQCQKIEDATVLVGSSNGRAFDRMGVWFGPYVAGPYAEGAYELNFPVDAAVLRAVNPEYASAFAAR